MSEPKTVSRETLREICNLLDVAPETVNLIVVTPERIHIQDFVGGRAEDKVLEITE